jgi:hypothetical protein
MMYVSPQLLSWKMSMSGDVVIMTLLKAAANLSARSSA